MPTAHDTLHAALAAVQSDLPIVKKGEEADTGRYTYSYATLYDCNRALLPLLAEHGLTWVCIPDVVQHVMEGVLTHAATGDTIVATWTLPNTNDPQAIGSAITYGRRYLLTALVGLAHPQEDDDGEAAQAAPPPELSDRDRVANLVLEYVPEPHVPFLLDAYQQGAGSLDDVDDVNIGRMRRALSSRGSRERVLAGVADRYNAEHGDGDGSDEPPAPDPDGSPPDAPDSAASASGRTDEDGSSSDPKGDVSPDADPLERIAQHYDDLNVVQITALIRNGTTELHGGGGTLALPDPAEAGHWMIDKLESDLADATDDGERRKTVDTALGSAGWSPGDWRHAEDPRGTTQTAPDEPSGESADDGADEGPDAAEGDTERRVKVEPEPLPDGDDPETRVELLRRWKAAHRDLAQVDDDGARKALSLRMRTGLGEDATWRDAAIDEVRDVVQDVERRRAEALPF